MSTETLNRTYSAGTLTAEVIDYDPRVIQAMTTVELREELARGLTLVAENLFRTGQIWIELERRGEDLSDLRKGLAAYLPQIGTGRMDARVLVKFAGAPALLRAVSILPVDEQVRLATGGTVPLVAEDLSVVPTDPLRLTAPQVAQVFSAGQIRSTAEQKEILTRRAARTIKKTVVQYDRAKGGRFLVGRQVVLMSQLLSAMAVSEPRRKAREKMVKVELELPEALVAQIRVAGDESKRDLGTTILAAMRFAGMID